MDNLIIKKNTDKEFTKPDIEFKVDSGICEISGVSIMESPEDFYLPIYDWVNSYIVENNYLKLILKLSYYNTSSSKMIFDLLLILKQFQENGGELIIEWHFDEWDTDMEEDIEGLMEDTGLNIKIVKIPG